MQIIDLVPDLRPTILAARQVRDERNTLARFLPYKEGQTVSYRLGRQRRLDQTVPVRAIDAPAIPIRRPGVVDIKGDLPAVTPIEDLSEQDLTNEMVMAMQLNGLNVDWLPSVNSAAGRVALTVDNTFEAMRGQVLSTLALALTAEDGVTHDVSFAADASQIVTVTTPWNTTGDPFKDLEAAHEAHLDRAGGPAGIMLTTSRVKRTLLTKLQALFPQQPVGQTSLSGYLADRGLPDVYTYDRTFTAYDGTKSRVYPEGYATFLPAEGEPVGRTELGVTQEAVQQVQRGTLNAAEAPGVTVVTLGRDNPVQRAVKAAAIGMPVIHDIEAVSVIRSIFG